jgi:hypothetical protein
MSDSTGENTGTDTNADDKADESTATEAEAQADTQTVKHDSESSDPGLCPGGYSGNNRGREPPSVRADRRPVYLAVPRGVGGALLRGL